MTVTPADYGWKTDQELADEVGAVFDLMLDHRERSGGDLDDDEAWQQARLVVFAAELSTAQRAWGVQVVEDRYWRIVDQFEDARRKLAERGWRSPGRDLRSVTGQRETAVILEGARALRSRKVGADS